MAARGLDLEADIALALRLADAAGDAIRPWFRNGAAAERKSVNAGRALVAVSPARVRDGAWARLLHPAEPPLPAGGPLRELAVDYPRREITLGGRRVNWLLAVFVLSLGFGLVLKYPLRVEW